MESKPESKEFEDLRLNEPFQELMDFAYSMNLAALNDQEHSHVPYVVILLQAMKAWKD